MKGAAYARYDDQCCWLMADLRDELEQLKEQCNADQQQLAMAAEFGQQLLVENNDLKAQCEEFRAALDVKKQLEEEVRTTAKNAAETQERYQKMTAHCRELEQDNEDLQERIRKTPRSRDRTVDSPFSKDSTNDEINERRSSMLRAEASDRVQELEIENKALRRELEHGDFAMSPRRGTITPAVKDKVVASETGAQDAHKKDTLTKELADSRVLLADLLAGR